MADMISYVEQQNKRRREILMGMGVETIGEDKVSLHRSLVASDDDGGKKV